MQRAGSKIINMLSIDQQARDKKYEKNVSNDMERDYCLTGIVVLKVRVCKVVLNKPSSHRIDDAFSADNSMRDRYMIPALRRDETAYKLFSGHLHFFLFNI
jgi:hypothetical protein